MKWNNKSHEYDLFYDQMKDRVSPEKEIWLFGSGKIGKERLRILNLDYNVAGFIDNDKGKVHKTIEGKPVISIEEYVQKQNRGYIVVTTSMIIYSQIKLQLEQLGFGEFDDYCHWEYFFGIVYPVILQYQKNKNYIELSQISVTERCTLSCIDCAHACNYVSYEAKDLSIEQVKTSADTFFKFCDYVQYFVLIGGEPLLYKRIEEVIDYIGREYRNRMFRFQISTNGSIIPSDSVLEKCKEWNVFFLISNYSKQIPRLESQYKKLVETLNQYEIAYDIFDKETEWTDYGFRTVNRSNNPEELTKVFDRCHTDCHEIREEKFYYCVMARSVSDNMRLGIGEHDYLELGKMNPLSLQDRRTFMEYSLGFSERGYLEMCRHCNGADRDKYPIPAAIQGRKII